MDISSSFFLLAQLDLSNPEVNPIAKLANIGTLVNLLTPLLMSGAALIFGGMLLLMAYKWMTAGSDQEQVAQARNIGTYAVLGIVIILSAYVLVKLIGFVLGIEIPI